MKGKLGTVGWHHPLPPPLHYIRWKRSLSYRPSSSNRREEHRFAKLMGLAPVNHRSQYEKPRPLCAQFTRGPASIPLPRKMRTSMLKIRTEIEFNPRARSIPRVLSRYKSREMDGEKFPFVTFREMNYVCVCGWNLLFSSKLSINSCAREKEL